MSPGGRPRRHRDGLLRAAPPCGPADTEADGRRGQRGQDADDFDHAATYTERNPLRQWITRGHMRDTLIRLKRAVRYRMLADTLGTSVQDQSTNLQSLMILRT